MSEETREAANLSRARMQEDPEAYIDNIIYPLLKLSESAMFSKYDDHSDAIQAAQWAVDLLLNLKDPVVYNTVLAQSLNNLASCLAEPGQHKEASVVAPKAVNLLRACIEEARDEEDPTAYNDDLAQSLNTLASCLFELGLQEEAMGANKEAITLYRALAEKKSAYNVDLAQSLNNLAQCLKALGLQEEFVVADQEANKLLLATKCVYTPQSLSILGAERGRGVADFLKTLMGMNQPAFEEYFKSLEETA